MPADPTPDEASAGDGTVSRSGEDTAGGESRAGRRKAALRKRATVLRVVGVTVAVLALVTGLTVVYMYRHLSGNLTVEDLSSQLENRPSKIKVSDEPKEPLNVLVMGSDTRDCEGCKIDKETGAEASDTTILLHLSADRERAYGVSIPRDSMVDRPECDHGRIPADDYVLWNAAYGVGGPGCTIQQFEQLTGIYVDHHVVVDFAGFRNMVDAIGGVEVCIPETIDDRAHGIYLEAGTREVQGKEALAYVRQRHGVGDGSDIGRMKRQQAFVASMANKVVSARTLADPVRLFRFLDAATESLRVDPGLENIGRLTDLGLQFQDIGLSKIQFITIPWKWDPQDPNRVVWAPEAEQVWDRLARDKVLTPKLTTDAISAAKPTTTKKGGKKGPSSSPSEDPADDPRQVGLCG